MSDKDQYIIFTGTVVEVLAGAHFRVELDDVKDIVLAHLSGKMRQNNIRVILGDRVQVDVSTYDTKKGRITKRLR